MRRIACYFERVDVPRGTSPEQKSGMERAVRNLREWKELFPPHFFKDRPDPPVLAMTRNAAGDAAAGMLTIEDTRPVAVSPRFSFDGIEAAVYAAADEGKTAEEIARALPHDFPGASNAPNTPNAQKVQTRDVEDILQGFVASRLMVNLGGIYLALAVAAPFREYLPAERMPGGWYRRKRPASTP